MLVRFRATQIFLWPTFLCRPQPVFFFSLKTVWTPPLNRGPTSSSLTPSPSPFPSGFSFPPVSQDFASGTFGPFLPFLGRFFLSTRLLKLPPSSFYSLATNFAPSVKFRDFWALNPSPSLRIVYFALHTKNPVPFPTPGGLFSGHLVHRCLFPKVYGLTFPGSCFSFLQFFPPRVLLAWAGTYPLPPPPKRF